MLSIMQMPLAMQIENMFYSLTSVHQALVSQCPGMLLLCVCSTIASLVLLDRFSKGSVNVLHSRADRRVSGMAFDEALLRALKSSAVGKYVASSRSHAASFALQLEKTKRVLSVNRESSLRISPTDHDNSEEIKIAITRRAFEVN